jgi:phospholipase C
VSDGSPSPPTHTTEGVSRQPGHIVVAVFENKARDQVLGSGAAPTFDRLAAEGAEYTHSYGIAHPSQPNYLALFSGSTQGITDDSCPHSFTAPNLADQLLAAGQTFTGYAEGLPAPGYAGCAADRYARKHAPWTNFAGLPAGAAQPFSAFPSDPNRLPQVAFVIPDMCHDMHDCSVSTGDGWLHDYLLSYAEWARTHNSLLIVTFDEDDGKGTNMIPTLVVGEGIRPTRIDTAVDQYTVLHTIEDCLGLPMLGPSSATLPGVCS